MLHAIFIFKQFLYLAKPLFAADPLRTADLAGVAIVAPVGIDRRAIGVELAQAVVIVMGEPGAVQRGVA